MDKISICYIIGTLNQGGAERQLVELIKNINKNRYDVTLCLFLEDKYFYTEIDKIENLRIIKYKNGFSQKLIRIVYSGYLINQVLRREKFDLVHTMLYFNGLLVRLFAPRSYKNRIISSIRTDFSLYSKSKVLIEKKLLRDSYVIANTKKAADSFKKVVNDKFRDRITYIYNGFNILTIKKKSNPVITNPELLRIIVVGRLTYLKNQLQIVRTLHEKYEGNYILDIYGANDDQSDTLKSYVERNELKNNVFFKGENLNIKQLYCNYDLFILSSHHEGCPNVLFEAMLSGVFSIVSDNSNSDNFIINKENGLVYDNSDKGLYDAIKTFVKIVNTKKYNQIIDNAYEFAKKSFDISIMIKNYDKLYHEILKNITYNQK